MKEWIQHGNCSNEQEALTPLIPGCPVTLSLWQPPDILYVSLFILTKQVTEKDRGEKQALEFTLLLVTWTVIGKITREYRKHRECLIRVFLYLSSIDKGGFKNGQAEWENTTSRNTPSHLIFIDFYQTWPWLWNGDRGSEFYFASEVPLPR